LAFKGIPIVFRCWQDRVAYDENRYWRHWPCEPEGRHASEPRASLRISANPTNPPRACKSYSHHEAQFTPATSENCPVDPPTGGNSLNIVGTPVLRKPLEIEIVQKQRRQSEHRPGRLFCFVVLTPGVLDRAPTIGISAPTPPKGSSDEEAAERGVVFNGTGECCHSECQVR